MRVLKVDYGVVRQIAIECDCTRQKVALALKGATSTPDSRKIRALAIAKYNARAVKEVELTQKELLDGMGCE